MGKRTRISVEKLWNDYRMTCMASLPTEQCHENQKVFMTAVYSTLMVLRESEVSEDDLGTVMQNMSDQCVQFFEHLKPVPARDRRPHAPA